MSNDSDIHHIS